MPVVIGDIAPDFVLPGTGGRDYRLSEYHGHSVVLAFYPGDSTPVCTMQLNAYTRDIDQFGEVDAQVIAISPQGVDSHDAFAHKQGGFAFPLLADVDKHVGMLYGVVGPLGFYRRSVFVIDPHGVIRYLHRSATGATFKRTDDLIKALKG